MTAAGPFDIGDDIQLTTNAVDAAGDPANCATMTLTVTQPDGSTVTPAVTNPPAETGQYAATFTAAQAGRHRISWTGADPAYVDDDVLDVLPADPRFVISLADAREQLRRLKGSSRADDAEIRLYMAAITPIVEDIAGLQTIETRAWTVDGGRCAVLLPDPLIAVTAVTENGAALEESPGDYTVDTDAGIVYRGSMIAPFPFIGGLRNVSVTYTTGHGVVAANVRLAARIILRHLWQADQNTPRAQIAIADDTDVVDTPGGFAIPRRAAELLAPTWRENMPGFA